MKLKHKYNFIFIFLNCVNLCQSNVKILWLCSAFSCSFSCNQNARTHYDSLHLNSNDIRKIAWKVGKFARENTSLVEIFFVFHIKMRKTETNFAVIRFKTLLSRTESDAWIAFTSVEIKKLINLFLRTSTGAMFSEGAKEAWEVQFSRNGNGNSIGNKF